MFNIKKIGNKLTDTVAMLVMLKMLSLTKENYRTLYEKQVFEQALWLELIRNVKCVGCEMHCRVLILIKIRKGMSFTVAFRGKIKKHV